MLSGQRAVLFVNEDSYTIRVCARAEVHAASSRTAWGLPESGLLRA